jgi:phosphotransferase system enzyme I (PtsI)
MGEAPERKEQLLRGIGVSPGVVMGYAFVLSSSGVNIQEKTISEDAVASEIVRFEEALIETRGQLKRIQKDLEQRAGMGDASILDAHLMVLDDRVFIEEVITGVKKDLKNAEWIVQIVSEKYASVLAAVEDDYLRERVADIKDVARRVMRNLVGEKESSLGDLKQKHIVIAPDLAPSETASMRKDMVLGFATDLGSPTSHTAVMARALEIPAIVGLRDVTQLVKSGDEVLIDGNKGVFIINPSEEQLEKYGKVAEARATIQEELTSLKHEPAETKDGKRIMLSANVEGTDEVETLLEYGAEGIGLFRSEYLYLSKDKIVGEDEQTEAYTKVATRLAPAPVIIRTLDLGGDKYLPEAHLPKESNPFLGCRSIRLSLLYPEHFKAQLRAILRASVTKNVKIMYPMISSVGEVDKANKLLREAMAELDEQGVDFDRDIEVGIMIEIPAAALAADALAKKVQFFSIGTNDLIQYTLAVDRVNERVAYLYEPTHPSVLKLIQMTVEAAHQNGIWVGVCGEMAADPLMTALLLGLGVDELSVAPAAVPLVKDAVRSLTLERSKGLVSTISSCESSVEVLAHCRKLIQETAPELLELI